VAVTTVTQVFHNTENRAVEALYTFPVPRGASVANFSMWIGGKEMIGEVVEKQRARQIYDSYKKVQRDPGLLEQTDFRTFDMRIFPIAAGADQKVQISYYQEMESDHDWATYVYPLATTTRGKVDTRVSGRFAITFDIKSAVPIAELESPSHPDAFVFAKQTEHYRSASLETKEGSLAKDVVLAQHLVRPRTGIDVLTSARLGEDGFFRVTLTAGEETKKQSDGMDYVFLLDISGSMRDDGKLLLSKDCLGAFIDQLGPNDRFEVMTFNIRPELAFKSIRAADAEAKQAAVAFLGVAQANGGTVLNPALTTAYKYADPDRPLNVVVLSDGMTEQRERQQLLQLIQQRPRNTKVFCIGVGNDVNRPLLEQIAEDSGGLASFLSRGDDFQRQAKAFRRKLMNPVATDLALQISGVETLSIEPAVMPNLYQGTPITIYGRYRGSGKATLKLRGNLNGVAWEQAGELNLPDKDDTNPEIERMWASRRIDGLLKSADRSGSRESVAPEVIRLGEGFSIVTEYTSFLVLENDAEFQRWKIERNNLTRLGRDRKTLDLRERELAELRNKSIQDLGPQQPAVTSAKPGPSPVVSPANAPTSGAPVAPAPTRSNSFDVSMPSRSSGGGGGSGPVGPLFVAFAAWLSRRRANAKA
jgi:Ca-activated chloride channel homolog